MMFAFHGLLLGRMFSFSATGLLYLLLIPAAGIGDDDMCKLRDDGFRPKEVIEFRIK